MYTIKTLNAISPVGLAKLNNKQFDVAVDTDAPDGILVRSADMLNTAFNDNLLAIARAGAGVNNIPLDRCSEQGIVVFNTPGANANAVAELVIGMLIAGSRNVAVAAQWCQGLAGDPAMAKTVEKGKKQFVGNEIKGKTLGVIGLGAIGSRVANCAIELGMEVYGYDPYISIDAAWNLSSQVRHCVNLNDMLPLCDYITIHVPYLPTTRDTINAQTLALCKDGVKILNYARGELVNTEALLEAMETGKVSGYMTDFPSEAILGKPGIVCTPHLGASTPEAEDNCAVMAAQEISDYLKNGNITHSVNMPEVHQPRHLYAGAENGNGLLHILHRREGGGNTDVAVIGVDAVGEGGAGGGHGHAGLLAQGQRPLGGAGHGVKGDEVAALGPPPGGDLQRRDLPVQRVHHTAELGAHDGGVLLHQLQGVGLVLEIEHMALLVHLVEADDLNGGSFSM